MTSNTRKEVEWPVLSISYYWCPSKRASPTQVEINKVRGVVKSVWPTFRVDIQVNENGTPSYDGDVDLFYKSKKVASFKYGPGLEAQLMGLKESGQVTSVLI